ncbi:MAG TPA: sigma-70 family RNA polymerase sigma factor [Rhodocyclaceae bacterium]|uniref:sigma-70 family RNA polymerase sigma factor n=1 Tax=Zoogloea sp. TaxID=49181 RepID=UPI002C73311B|nr:sigma-70 family RNA polymerase sigma factor [Zoogloea sp.]HMV63508.1 sigma-70 family RNA polymerase sigma factor [Rhodocyclaceae bacterium]HMW52121.1 sigma-70 family RNA polymerase sigma factor [Rhodocyclaceae bacterium]HMY48435.1 sigma-70 family RNA polymerase sigma factor [Rhodocyclaceae bacterium]HMZ75923.1 sigma-70 family RNA polymerase sigma factor [Rhodocyclaceae bacterium]HNA67971.1 sigma-70 family RNA polymerase sigma factor [Rhodocyclaceae bacterium]
MTETLQPSPALHGGQRQQGIGAEPEDEEPRAAECHDPLAPRGAAHAAAGAGALEPLLKRIAHEDESALSALYDATCSRVYGLVLRILRDGAAAEEVTGDVFFQVWRQALRYDSARGQALSWILTIARTRALDHLRRVDPAVRHPEPTLLLDAEPSTDTDPQDILLACKDNALLHSALAALEPVQRQMIALVFFRGLTHEEVASHTATPLGTVKSHVRRALINLRSALAADLDRSIVQS